jgi:hypothetical protein
LPAGGGEVVFDAPAVSWSAFYEVLGGETAGEGSEGLFGLERGCGQFAGGRSGGAADRAQGVPLGQCRADGLKGTVEGPVLSVLGLFDRSAEFLQLIVHASSLRHDQASLYKDV